MTPTLVEHVHQGLEEALGTLWTAVTRADGAVGFLVDDPEEDIRAAAAATIADVRAGRLRMLVIGSDGPAGGGLAGTVFLERMPGPRKAHGGYVLRLMVHPDAQGRGYGGALLDAVAADARALGLEHLLLSVRGGTTLPGFYRRRGWTEVGRFPGALRLGPGDIRDEYWFQLRLGPVTATAGKPVEPLRRLG